jgi:hypothetical protein
VGLEADRRRRGLGDVSLHGGIGEHGVVILGAAPLRVVDNLGAIEAAVDVGGDVAGNRLMTAVVAPASRSTSAACRSGSTVNTFTRVMRSWSVAIVAIGRLPWSELYQHADTIISMLI